MNRTHRTTLIDIITGITLMALGATIVFASEDTHQATIQISVEEVSR